MRFNPLADRILVDKKDPEERTRGGLIIPDQAKDKPQEGTVVAVGEGRESSAGEIVALRVKPGDFILFGKYAGTEIKLNGKTLYIMREEEVLGILTPECGDELAGLEVSADLGEKAHILDSLEQAADSVLDSAHF